MADQGINWKQILATAAVTGTVTIGTGMLLFNLQGHRDRLIYSVTDTIPFEATEHLVIYHVEVRNEGTAVVKDVACELSTEPGVVRQYRIKADAALAYTDKADAHHVRATFPTLNPDETVTISVLAAGDKALPSRPGVSLRGEGVKGTEATRATDEPSLIAFMVSAVLAAFAGITTMTLFRAGRRFVPHRIAEAIFDEDAPTHTDDQRQVLAYLFGLRGMTVEASEYLVRPSKCFYWSEADRIGAIAVGSRDAETATIRKRVLLSLLEYAEMAEASRAIVHYNIARIAKNQNDEPEAVKHLELAQGLSPKRIKSRMELDPLFTASAA